MGEAGATQPSPVGEAGASRPKGLSFDPLARGTRRAQRGGGSLPDASPGGAQPEDVDVLSEGLAKLLAELAQGEPACWKGGYSAGLAVAPCSQDACCSVSSAACGSLVWREPVRCDTYATTSQGGLGIGLD